MLLSKIKKHFSLFSIQRQQNKTLKKMSLEKDTSLINIINAFNTIKSGLYDDEDLKAFQECETYRSYLLKNDSLVSYEIFGINKKTQVKDICAKATSKSIWARFLYLITKELNNPSVLEIGTNLGISGSYILEALKNKENSMFITMEGVPALCDIASSQFKKITPAKKYVIHQGLYQSTFPKLLSNNTNFNLIFIDGNHKKNPTIQYFHELKSCLIYPSIFIFDDINWSSEMQEAWRIIKSDKTVSYSIDMFKWGIVILNKLPANLQKHYRLHLSY